MSDDNDPPPNDDAADDEAFLGFLDKVGPTWLEAKLTELAKSKPDLFPKTTTKSPEPEGNDLVGFLRAELKEARETGKNLRGTLEDIFDVLTPEQRAELKARRSTPQPSPKKDGVEGLPSPKPRKQNAPASDPKPAPRRPAFLKRL